MAKPLFPAEQPNCHHLTELIQVVDGGTVSKTLIDAFGTKQLLFSMDAGQELTEHRSPMLAILQVIQGRLTVGIAGQSHDLAEGGWINFPPNAPHSVKAMSRCIWLLTMVRAS